MRFLAAPVTAALVMWAAYACGALWLAIPVLVLFAPALCFAFRPEAGRRIPIQAASLGVLWAVLAALCFTGSGHLLTAAALHLGALAWIVFTLASMTGIIPRNPGDNRFTRAVFDLMPALTVILLAWVWVGRVWFGALGVGAFALTFLQIPFLVAALALTTWLAVTQPPGRPRWLLALQAVAQTVVWLCLLVYGAALVDSDDLGTLPGKTWFSVLTAVFGADEQTLELSRTLEYHSYTVGMYAWLVLLVALLAARFRPRRPIRAGQPEPPRTFEA